MFLLRNNTMYGYKNLQLWGYYQSIKSSDPLNGDSVDEF